MNPCQKSFPKWVYKSCPSPKWRTLPTNQTFSEISKDQSSPRLTAWRFLMSSVSPFCELKLLLAISKGTGSALKTIARGRSCLTLPIYQTMPQCPASTIKDRNQTSAAMLLTLKTPWSWRGSPWRRTKGKTRETKSRLTKRRAILQVSLIIKASSFKTWRTGRNQRISFQIAKYLNISFLILSSKAMSWTPTTW